MTSQTRNVRPDDAEDITDADLTNRKMGDNALQGNDQENVRNQRHEVPDVKQEADDVVESFEKLDKEERARRDLGKHADGK